MWYFAWILGTGLAALAAVLNGMWFEAREQRHTALIKKLSAVLADLAFPM